jgi:hypothetical protein
VRVLCVFEELLRAGQRFLTQQSAGRIVPTGDVAPVR